MWRWITPVESHSIWYSTNFPLPIKRAWCSVYLAVGSYLNFWCEFMQVVEGFLFIVVTFKQWGRSYESVFFSETLLVFISSSFSLPPGVLTSEQYRTRSLRKRCCLEILWRWAWTPFASTRSPTPWRPSATWETTLTVPTCWSPLHFGTCSAQR